MYLHLETLTWFSSYISAGEILLFRFLSGHLNISAGERQVQVSKPLLFPSLPTFEYILNLLILLDILKLIKISSSIARFLTKKSLQFHLATYIKSLLHGLWQPPGAKIVASKINYWIDFHKQIWLYKYLPSVSGKRTASPPATVATTPIMNTGAGSQ